MYPVINREKILSLTPPPERSIDLRREEFPEGVARMNPLASTYGRGK
jgi:hypothetical protein